MCTAVLVHLQLGDCKVAVTIAALGTACQIHPVNFIVPLYSYTDPKAALRPVPCLYAPVQASVVQQQST